MVKPSIISPATLATITNLFKAFQEHDIIYCHWKAHDTHMLASLSGNSDLDILFDSEQTLALESLLIEIGFKKFESIEQRQYKNIVDYLILDKDSGKLVHLHAHFKLKVGKTFLLELNLEQRILQSRLFNVQYGTYCIHPNYQLVLFYLAESLKLRNRDRIRFWFNKEKKLSPKVIGEYRWLMPQVNQAEVRYIFHEILKHPEPVNDLIENELSLSLLFKLADKFKQAFSSETNRSLIIKKFTHWFRELTLLGKKVLARVLVLPIPIRRINPRGGRVLAFCGKEPTIANSLDTIQDVFSKKLDVFRISFDPRKSIHEFSLSREEKRKLNQVQSAREKGMLVLCDQFPIGLNEIHDRGIQQRLPDIIFKWQGNDQTTTGKEKIFDNSNPRPVVVPLNPATSFDAQCSLIHSEIWKIL